MEKSCIITTLSKPAQRALISEGITSAEQLAQKTKKELLAFHGLGPSAIPKINEFLALKGMALKK
jgi:DNA-directed RNA polymerase alpha subunit